MALKLDLEQRGLIEVKNEIALMECQLTLLISAEGFTDSDKNAAEAYSKARVTNRIEDWHEAEFLKIEVLHKWENADTEDTEVSIERKFLEEYWCRVDWVYAKERELADKIT